MPKILVTPYQLSTDRLDTVKIYDIESKKEIGSIPRELKLYCETSALGFHHAPFHPYGIDVEGNEILVASNKKIGRFCCKTKSFLGLIDVPVFVNTHHIRRQNETLYTCNARTDSIGIHKKNSSFYISARDGSVKKNLDYLISNIEENHFINDTCHVNSLEIDGDYLYYSMHFHGKIPSQFWRYNIKLSTTEYLFSAGKGCHDIKIIENKLWALSTYTGEILSADLRTKKILFYPVADPEKEFLLGLDFYDGELYYGLSYIVDQLSINIGEYKKIKGKTIGNNIEPIIDISRRTYDLLKKRMIEACNKKLGTYVEPHVARVDKFNIKTNENSIFLKLPYKGISDLLLFLLLT